MSAYQNEMTKQIPNTLPLKEKFDLPEGMIYLNGNSLGPLPKCVNARVSRMVTEEWGEHLIKGWNVDDWMGQPSHVGDSVAKLIGAPAGSVVMGDTLSIKVYQALAAALQMRPDRKVILSDSGNFPTDLYMAEGLIKHLDQGHELRIVEPEEVMDAISEETAAVLLTEADYRTGRLHQMSEVTEKAHQKGAVMIWDLAHSAGALPIDLTGSNCEFAIGCTYKYLNGGPGAPAFIYVRPDLSNDIAPVLSGWLGHRAPFEFDLDYRPADAIERMRVGTPPVLQMTALEAALSVWDGIDMQDIRDASIALSGLFIEEVERRCPDLTLISPRDPQNRGSHVSFSFEHGYAAMQALISKDVIGDFRAPDVMRFGFTPLFLDRADIIRAVDVLQGILDSKEWNKPEFQTKSRVT